MATSRYGQVSVFEIFQLSGPDRQPPSASRSGTVTSPAREKRRGMRREWWFGGGFGGSASRVNAGMERSASRDRSPGFSAESLHRYRRYNPYSLTGFSRLTRSGLIAGTAVFPQIGGWH
ncbi:MAG: hypothetical protein Ct9H300mP1_30840 [Planctomycetaceae bacterium]|nr:MAG: hypothetical protein Ct9H300mP1_30840 [Planctomycetaceae bacterium]